MKFKQACCRTGPPGGGASLEELISADNEVRFIDAFVNSLPLEKLGFRTDFPENGRPAYHPSILLKLLVYGYLNRVLNIVGLERLLAYCAAILSVLWHLRAVHGACWPGFGQRRKGLIMRAVYLQIAIFS